jgi:hypothetical protein
MIFGVAATGGLDATPALLLLVALSLVSCAFSPFVAALALRAAED